MVFCQEIQTVPSDHRFSEKMVRDKTGKLAEVGLGGLNISNRSI